MEVKNWRFVIFCVVLMLWPARQAYAYHMECYPTSSAGYVNDQGEVIVYGTEYVCEAVTDLPSGGGGGDNTLEGGGGTGGGESGGGDTGGLVDTQIGRMVQEDQDGSDPCTTDHPVVIATGKKFKPELDFVVPPDEQPLSVFRLYDKSLNRIGIFGPRWASSLEYTLSFDHSGTQCHGRLDTIQACSSATSPTRIFANRPSGFALVFEPTGSSWQ